MKEVLLSIKTTLTSISKIALIFTILMTLRCVGFIPYGLIPDIVGYAVMAMMSVYCMTKSKNTASLIVVFVVYCALNIVVTQPDAIFRPWLRYAFWLVLMLSVSPLLQSAVVRNIRAQVFSASIWFLGILSVLTFFCRFVGVNFAYTGFAESYLDTGAFGGLYNHSMMMGLCSGLASIFFFYKYAETRKKVYAWMGIFCMGDTLFSASRSALMCTVFGNLAMLYKQTGGKSKYIRSLAAVTFVGAISFPIWGGAMDAVVEKQAANMSHGSTFSSRDDKWNARISEFGSDPIFGYGFCAVDSRLDSVSEDGTIEPGSSWLSVLSMTGLIGLFIFGSIYYKAFKLCSKHVAKVDALLYGLLALFGVHMMAEGYVFSAGSFGCYILWLVLACGIDRQYKDDIIEL